MKLTEEDLLVALAEAVRKANEKTFDSPPGATMNEIADQLGISIESARRQVREAVAEGLIEGNRGIRPNIIGERASVPVYRLVDSGQSV
jgi:DNA-binding Lrp family transcriptional regulator